MCRDFESFIMAVVLIMCSTHSYYIGIKVGQNEIKDQAVKNGFAEYKVDEKQEVIFIWNSK